MAHRDTVTFAALVFFTTSTIVLGVVLVTSRTEPAATEGLTAGERVNVAVFHRASPSVVHLTAGGRTIVPSDPDSAERLPESGSGVVWDERGYVVTNDHLVRDRGLASVAFADGSVYETLYVGSLQQVDLAVLFVLAPPEKLVPIARGSARDLRVGQTVLAIGNPFGLDQTLTVGVVSGLDRQIETFDGAVLGGVIQTDAAVNPGNSGGPLLDTGGRLVGINTSIAEASATSAGVGFAIPVEAIEEVYPILLRDGLEPWPEVGLVLAPDAMAEEFLSQARRAGDEPTDGVLVLEVLSDSPAEEAGIEEVLITGAPQAVVAVRHVLVAADGVELLSRETLSSIFARKAPGDAVVLDLWHRSPSRRGPVTLTWQER